MARAPKSYTVDSWETSEGKFGVCITEPARARDAFDTGIMEIELSPEKLIELSSDLLQLGLRMKKRQENVNKHSSGCTFVGHDLKVEDACMCDAWCDKFDN